MSITNDLECKKTTFLTQAEAKWKKSKYLLQNRKKMSKERPDLRCLTIMHKNYALQLSE